jgi:GDP-fucose transporter C1
VRRADRGSLGIVFGVLSSCTTALHSIVIKSSLPHVNGSTIHLAWYTNLLSTAAILPVVVVMGELKGIIAMMADPKELGRFASGGAVTVSWSAHFVCGLSSCLQGIFGFLICIAGFLSIKVTSPVTHMVSSAARGVVQTLLSVWFFNDVITG